MAARSSQAANGSGTVDTLGLVLRVVVHPANLQDRDGARLVLTGLEPPFPRLHHLWTDQGYTGTLLEWIEQELGWTVEVVERSPRRGFIVTPDHPFQRVAPLTGRSFGSVPGKRLSWLVLMPPAYQAKVLGESAQGARHAPGLTLP